MDEKEPIEIIKQAEEEGWTDLVLSHKELTSLPPQIAKLTNLTRLDLDCNELTALPPEIGNLTRLERLWLRQNQLTTLPPEIGNLEELVELVIIANELVSLPPEIGNLKNLLSLFLSTNRLTYFPTHIGNLTNLRILDLNKNALTLLPPEIGNLTNLEALSLCENQLTSLPPEIGNLLKLTSLAVTDNPLKSLPREIGNLTNLDRLYLDHNELISLPTEICKLTSLKKLDLADNQLTSLPTEIGSLTSLRELYLCGNRLNSLPPEICKLTNLDLLDLQSNDLTSLPPEIGELRELRILNLFENSLTILPAEIGNLENLDELGLNANELISLPPDIGKLANLFYLDLDYNQLTSLPSEIGNLTKLQELDLYWNPLTSPPPEIVEQGTKAVLAYLRSKLKDKRTQWRSKMLLVGEGGVGKTSLLKALFNEPYNPEEETTHGIDIRPLELKHPELPDITMQLNTWDFGGQQIYHSTHQFFLTERSLFILVWDLRHGWKAGELYKWLDIIHARAPDSPIIIVGAHLDERDSDLPIDDMVRKYPRIVGHYKVSNKDLRGIEEVRKAISNAAAKLPLMGEEWPADWLDSADAIREKTENYIQPKQLFELIKNHNVTGEDAAVLAQWLHELGYILYFRNDPKLNDTVILNPHWVTKHISDVLEYDEVKDDGIFTRGHMDKLWCNLEPWTRDHFLRLMEQFDLSYRTLEDKEISIVVERLSLDPPGYETEWDGIRQRGLSNEISMKFCLNSTLPPGIPTWFIARTHRFTTRTHWRYGALFTDRPEKKHLGLIRAFDHDRYLHLTVRGPSPHNFFALLKDGLELTLARYSGLDIKRTIPCPGHDGQPCTHEFDYEHLLGAIERHPPVIETLCPVGFVNVAIPQLLFGWDWAKTENEVLSHIESLQSTVATGFKDLKGGQEDIIIRLRELTELAQREFANAYRREQSKIDSHCPNVFTIRPMEEKIWGLNWFRKKIELQLYCQEPGCWHPTVKGGSYVIKQPARWLRAMAPYIRGMVRVLKYASPLVGPVLGAAASAIEKTMQNDLKLMNELVKKLPDIEESRQVELTEEIRESHYMQRAEGAELRGLRNLLEQLDPKQKWGDLKKQLTPEGHYLWLCEYHAAKYKQ